MKEERRVAASLFHGIFVRVGSSRAVAKYSSLHGGGPRKLAARIGSSGDRENGQFFGLKSATARSIHGCASVPADRVSSLKTYPRCSPRGDSARDVDRNFATSNPEITRIRESIQELLATQRVAKIAKRPIAAQNDRRVKGLRRDLTTVTTSTCDFGTRFLKRWRQA